MGVPTHGELSLREVDLALERHNLGPLPYPLRVPVHGETVQERRRLVAALPHDPRRLTWLTVLTRAGLSVDAAFLPGPGAGPVRAVAALADRHAVLAVQGDGDVLQVRDLPPDGLVPAIVALLPPADRGTEKSITVPTGPGSAPAGVLDHDPHRGGATAAASRQALARLAALPRPRGGQFAVNSRCDTRGRRRSPMLSWFDNDTGRYLCQTRDDWTTIAPADAAALRRRLAEMIAGPGVGLVRDWR